MLHNISRLYIFLPICQYYSYAQPDIDQYTVYEDISVFKAHVILLDPKKIMQFVINVTNTHDKKMPHGCNKDANYRLNYTY